MIPIRNSRQRCSIEHYDSVLFFSLVCYRNNLFTSIDPEKIIEFYNGFDNRDQLIRWMKERPKGASYIHEVEGDKDIIVVIPTADFNGKYARTCREEIFKGLHMIFVESGENPDPFFNYAHNCNVGIKKAMEYNPKWVVVSNDDMYKVDDCAKLRSELSIVSDKYEMVFTREGIYHSRIVQISRRTLRRNTLVKMLGKYERKRLRIEKKFSVDLIIGTTLGLKRFLYAPIKKFQYTGSIGIFSYKFIDKNMYNLFDETYINGTEDIDLSLQTCINSLKITRIDYSIGDLIGQTIGPYNSIRRLKGLINDCYFNFKFSQDLEY